MRNSGDDQLARRIVAMQAEPGGFWAGLASGAALPRSVLILVQGRMIAATSRHHAK